MGQVKTFKPQLVAVRNESLISELKEALADVEEKPEIIPGEEGIIEVDISVCLYEFGLWSQACFSQAITRYFSGCSSP